jgi:hypothetical protein
LPDRLFGKVPVQPHLQKYIPSRFPQIKSITRAVSSQARGDRDRHERGAGCGGRGGAADEQHGSGRRSRVVLTPRRWRQVGGKYPADDGDKKARSPGRARRKPLKPLRAGMPGESGEPRGDYARMVLFFPIRGCGCIEHPAFPTPLAIRAVRFLHHSGANASRERGGVPLHDVTPCVVLANARTHNHRPCGWSKVLEQRPSKRAPRSMGPRVREDDVEWWVSV